MSRWYAHIGANDSAGHELDFHFTEAVVFSSRRPRGGDLNEDAALVVEVSESSGVIAVADGAGGYPNGALAARVAIQSLQAALSALNREPNAVRGAILDGFEGANRNILALGNGSASTMSVVEFNAGSARTFHVGDSLAVIVGQRGKMKWSAPPHSPVGYAVEAGLIEPEDAIHHADRHLVSNLLGRNDMRIDIGPVVQLGQFDTILVASDGLADNVHLEETLSIVRTGSLTTAANELANLAKSRMESEERGEPSKPDDCTFVIARLPRLPK